MRSALFWDITRRRVVTFTDVSGQRIGPISTSQESEKMGPIRCPVTSVNNYHKTPPNIPEERRSQGGIIFRSMATAVQIPDIYCLPYLFFIQPLKELKDRPQTAGQNKKIIVSCNSLFHTPEIVIPWDLMTVLWCRNPTNCITLSNTQTALASGEELN